MRKIKMDWHEMLVCVVCVAIIVATFLIGNPAMGAVGTRVSYESAGTFAMDGFTINWGARDFGIHSNVVLDFQTPWQVEGANWGFTSFGGNWWINYLCYGVETLGAPVDDKTSLVSKSAKDRTLWGIDRTFAFTHLPDMQTWNGGYLFVDISPSTIDFSRISFNEFTNWQNPAETRFWALYSVKGSFLKDNTVAAVPEPSALTAWSSLGLMGVAIMAWRKRRRVPAR